MNSSISINFVKKHYRLDKPKSYTKHKKILKKRNLVYAQCK